MQVGSFGDIAFDFLTTPSGIERERKAALAEHQVAGGKAALERTGFPLDRCRYSIRLQRGYGEHVVDIESELERLAALLRGEAQPLFWGSVYMGDFVLSRLQEQRRDHLAIDVDIDLVEYA